MKTILGILHNLANSLQWLPGLITRVVVGIVFAQSGWGKLHHLPKVVEFFQSLGIPHPELQAPFVAGTELVCGVLLVAGLASRIVSIPLMATMVVAVATAKRADIETWTDVFAIYEFLYIVLLFWIVTYGPGPIALDRFLRRK